MIEVSQLDYAYPGHSFRLCIERFHVDAGSTAALIGPSGSGKSTLLSLIAGIILPSSGNILVDGSDLGELGHAARSELRVTKIGLVFQSFELLEHLTVFDNLLLPFRLSDALQLTDRAQERALELADDLGIAGQLKRYPRQLSQGERQRVAIGRALVTEPKILLADEPTGNLDPNSKRQVLDLLLEGASRQNVAVLMVTHDHGLLDRFQSRYEVGASKDGQPWATVSMMEDGCFDQASSSGSHDR